MTEKMKTVCVGRYLVDVPAQAEFSMSHERIDGFAIETVEENEAAFRQRISAREAEIAARGIGSDGQGGEGLVEAHDLHIAGMLGRTLVYGRSRGYLMEGDRRVYLESVSVEVHAHIGELSFSLTAHSTEESSAKEAEALLARLRLRSNDEIPSVPGFCIGRAIFAEPLPQHTTEHVAMHLGLPNHPDIGLTLVSMPGGGSEPSLIERSAQTDATMGSDVLMRMSKLRQGKRVINGISGEEVLVRAREFNFTTTYGFNWETPGVDDDPLQPYLSLELQTGLSNRPGGKPVETSLQEDALLALWDSIASSIRRRKNDPPPPSGPPPEPPGPKLGTVASAGNVCPQSGWWQCNAGAPGLDVHGGQVQYLRKGDRMPQALLLPRQNLWQKVRGVQPSIESDRPTDWKLVDKRQRPRRPAGVPLAQPGAPAGDAGLVTGGRAVAVGAYVRTGDICPASGWWRCEEAQALDGARWFARGSVLPVATFQVPTGVFGRPGGPEFIQRRSGWQLVRHADAPAEAQPSPLSPDGLQLDEPPALV